MSLIEPRLLKGFRDFLPEDMILRQNVISIIRNVFELHGFLPLETPTLEHLDILSGKYGEEGEKLIYKFKDQGERDVAMRYDLTVPLARVIAQYPELPRPLRRYQIQPVWRADKPQKGRFREFYQCDCDIIGVEDITAEAEIISAVFYSLKALGFQKFCIKINHREVLNGLLSYSGLDQSFLLPLCRSIDKLDKIGLDGVKDELIKNGLSNAAAAKILEMLQINDPVSAMNLVSEKLGKYENAGSAVLQLRKLFVYLKESGIADEYYKFDISLARGLDYYTGTVFETVVSEPKIGSITGGGRYDELISIFTKERIPAVGTSLGLERLIEVIKTFELLPVPASVSKALIINFSEETTGHAIGVGRLLRANGIPCEIYPEPGKIQKQFKYADKLHIPYVLIIGTEEMADESVMVKKLADGSQKRIALTDLVSFITDIS
jgi:histidyl-tRNA synthetase